MRRAGNGRRRRWTGVAVVVLLVALAGFLAEQYAARTEAEHRLFSEAGQSINGFLKDYCSDWKASHAAGEPTLWLASYSAEYRPFGRSSDDQGKWRWVEHASGHQPAGSTEVWQRQVEPAGNSAVETASADRSPRAILGARLAKNLTDFGSIERLTCKIDLIEKLEIGRQAILTVKLIADGADPQGRAIQDLVFQRWQLDATGPKRWTISRDELVDGLRTVGDRSALVLLDGDQSGIDFKHRRDPDLHMERYRDELSFGVIQHASGGVSAADYDQDGRPDLLFLDGVSSRLYRNLGPDPSGAPRFEDVTDAVGLDTIDSAHSGLFADFDNDGDRDLFVGRYLERNLYFENRGDDTFREVGADIGFDEVLPSSAVTSLDYDNDGDLDLYLAVYGNAFEEVPRIPFYARNGEANRLFRNDGDRFVDVTAEAGVGDTGWSLAVAAHDVDGDGWVDLASGNDFGRKNLYRNLGDGTFEEVAKSAGMIDFGFAMGLAFADSDGDGDGDLYTSNVNSNQRWFGEDLTARQYLYNFARTRWILKDAGEIFSLYRLLGRDWSKLFLQVGAGSSYFHNRGDGTFEEQPDGYTNRAGWGWGVAFFDLENDSDLDLYAANGWVTNTPDTDL